jgi:DNA polymerase
MEIRTVRLSSETDFEGWRAAARALRADGVEPARTAWEIDPHAPPPEARRERAQMVPRAFLGLARDVVLHRAPDRFLLLYKLLWRLGVTPELLRFAEDPDVARALSLARDVDRALQRMKALTEFHEVAAPGGGRGHAAWFAPAQRVTERAAPFFTRRFSGLPFALMTPDVSLQWSDKTLSRGPGVEAVAAPSAESLSACWRNFARRLAVPGETGGAPMEHRRPPMVARSAPPPPDSRIVRAAQRASRDGAYDTHPPLSLAEVAAGVDACRRCELWRGAAQGVAGEGPAKARIMLVGEQPGDQEDQAGRPFVGPAGAMLDKALAEAGVPRAEVYVTNAVKHFKHEVRGKRRLHKTPDTREVQACRWWLDAERRIVRPDVIVALGATAALSVFGRPTQVGKARGQAFALPEHGQAVVTYHPSFLLRTPDPDTKAQAYADFVRDLGFAWSLLS